MLIPELIKLIIILVFNKNKGKVKLKKASLKIKEVLKGSGVIESDLGELPFDSMFNHVIRWEKWYYTQEKSFIGHEVEGRCFTSYRGHKRKSVIYDLMHVSKATLFNNWTCDIQEIYGILASKSSLSSSKSLHEFAEKYCLYLIKECSDQALNDCLEWEDKYVFKYSFLRSYQWNQNRILLSNNSGSHHFAAARYIANKLKVDVKWCYKELIHFQLVDERVRSLINTLYMYVLPSKMVNELHKVFNSNDFMFFLRLPFPFEERAAICFYRDSEESKIINDLFKESGAFDLSILLISELDKNNRKRSEPLSNRRYRSKVDLNALLDLRHGF